MTCRGSAVDNRDLECTPHPVRVGMICAQVRSPRRTAGIVAARRPDQSIDSRSRSSQASEVSFRPYLRPRPGCDGAGRRANHRPIDRSKKAIIESSRGRGNTGLYLRIAADGQFRAAGRIWR